MINQMEKNFIRVQSVKDITIFASLIIVGLILAILPESEDLILCGYTIIAIGVIIALFLKSAYKDTQTKEKYRRKELFYSSEMKTSIISAMDSNPQSIEIPQTGKDQGLRLEIYYNETSGKAYVQLFEYIPYQYTPCSEMCEYEINQIAKLLK